MKKIREYIRKNKKKVEIWLLIVLIIYSFIIVMSFTMSHQNKIEEMSYNTFIEHLNNGDIDTVYYNTTSEYMTVTFLNDDTRSMTKEQRDKYIYADKDKKYVLYPGYDEFRKEVLEAGANIQRLVPIDIATMLSALISFAFPLMLIIMVMRMMKGQIGSLDKKELVQTSDVKFSDIIGLEEILDDVKFVTELIKDPQKGDKIGAKAPKGLLLVGPPGTGKTLIAKAIAGEAGVPFLYQNASSFIEMYVGLGARRVRELFKIARQSAPCIIFIDEIDAIGGNRSSVKGTSENDQTINALLQEMDGFNGRDGVFIIAATNRVDILDPALIRSGRFDRQIIVNPPRDWHIRKEMFKHYLSKFTVDENIDIESISKQVAGFSGADIAMVCNEASIIAVMKEKDKIDIDCLEEAIDKKIFKGNRAKKKSHEKDREIVAYHEGGHAVMTYLLGEPIARASIQSTISGVGGVVFREEKDTLFETNKDYKHTVLIAYAGRASEEIKFGDVTTGASNDITQATNAMLQYIEHLGFDSKFGLLDISVLNQEHLVSGESTVEKLSAMSIELYKECKELLVKNYDMVEKLAQKLLEKESLSGSEIEELLAKVE